MLKEHWRFIAAIERVIDNVMIIAIFFLSYNLRKTGVLWHSALLEPKLLAPLENYFVFLFIGLPLFNVFLNLFGAYQSLRYVSVWKLTRIIVGSALLVFLFEGWFLYLLKEDLSRSLLAIFCVLSGISVFILRYVVRATLRGLRSRGKNYRNLLIVGLGRQARDLYSEIKEQDELGIKPLGYCSYKSFSEERKSALKNNQGSLIVSDASCFEESLKKLFVDEVVFTDIYRHLKQVKELAKIAGEEGVGVSFAADLFSLGILKSDVSYIGGTPIVHFRTAPNKMGHLFFKRLLDVVISLIGLIFLSPLFLILFILIKLDSKGPVIFKQKRVGLNGRIFKLYKFRSMQENAEDVLSDLHAENQMKGPVFKIDNDPRITKIGKFLRKYSIDELPQLFNVLRGDMSLVGPRPPLPKEVKEYNRKQRRRLSMRPGITCIWQVSGRNKINDFNDWAKLDLEYIDNWSLFGDIKLLFRTIPVVITGEGAN